MQKQFTFTYPLTYILGKRHYLTESPTYEPNAEKTAYYNAYLLSNFGIIVDKPELLTWEHIVILNDIFKLNVPHSFYSNPQDIKYYTKNELFVEQVLSYCLTYGEDDCHVKVFKKDLPEFPVGQEIKVRKFKIINDSEFTNICKQITNDYCAYKRPWNNDELEEFKTLFGLGFYDNTEIQCTDNIFAFLEYDYKLARFLYKKDIVKYSVKCNKECSNLNLSESFEDLLIKIIPLVKDCPMSKKQCKYFNTLVKKIGLNKTIKKSNNINSPYRKAKQLMDKNDVIGAIKVFAENGSLLERNLKYLLSRANFSQALEILNIVESKNPVVLYQLMNNILDDNGSNRTFTFYNNNLMKHHTETEYETKWRKSNLDETTRRYIFNILKQKILDYYKQFDLGKVYLNKDFYKVAMPINTSASGKGLDIPPIGTKLKLNGEYIRTFVHWEQAFDIDSSLIIVDKDDNMKVMFFGNYCNKDYDNDILFSGDITGKNGTEYYDINVKNLKEKGIKYIIQTFHGYCSRLDSGEIYCGYQNKNNINTKAWDAKNIELKMHVKGDTRAFMSFAIDIQNDEVIILNTLLKEESRIVNTELQKTINKFISPNYLSINIGQIISQMSQLVDNIAEADIIFDDSYDEKENQKVIRSYDIERLNSIVSGNISNIL